MVPAALQAVQVHHRVCHQTMQSLRNWSRNALHKAQFFTLRNRRLLKENALTDLPPVFPLSSTPPRDMIDFGRYREKVMLFMRQVNREYTKRTILKEVYEKYFEEYKTGLLQYNEDELHVWQCSELCTRCTDMENNYLTAIY